MYRKFYSLIIIVITMFLCSACYEVIETTYYDAQPVSYSNTTYCPNGSASTYTVNYPTYDYSYPTSTYYYY